MATETDPVATEQPAAAPPPPLALADLLTDPDDIEVFAKLELLKLRMDSDEIEFKALKEEAGALIAVAGGVSGSYSQIIVTLTPGSKTNTFKPDRLMTTKIKCPHCEQDHFFPAGLVPTLYEEGRKADSVKVELAGKRGGGGKKKGAAAGVLS